MASCFERCMVALSAFDVVILPALLFLLCICVLVLFAPLRRLRLFVLHALAQHDIDVLFSSSICF